MVCSIPECNRGGQIRRGLCVRHYKRLMRHGDPISGAKFRRPRGMTEAETFAWFMPGDPPEEGCWDWTISTDSRGYGQFTRFINKKVVNIKAHVASHKIYNLHDPITAEKPHVLHSCDRPVCCQPKHLRAGTHQENMKDAWERGCMATKLTALDVMIIKASRLSQAELGRLYGVNRSAINAIVRGRSWKHIP